jgi:hypothetical protein
MPGVMLVLAILLGGVQLAGVQLRAQDAAADAARSWARGESSALVSSRLAAQLPGARVTRSRQADMVCATVSAPPHGAVAVLGMRASAGACALSGGR